jgi:hypothetical protein
VVHVVAGGEFAVGDVGERDVSDDQRQGVPGVDVGGGVLGGPVSEAVSYWDRSIGGDREDLHQLQQVSAMILGETALGNRRAHPRSSLAGGGPVGAVEGYRGGIVVQLRDVDPEAADHPQAEPDEQARPVCQEQRV